MYHDGKHGAFDGDVEVSFPTLRWYRCAVMARLSVVLYILRIKEAMRRVTDVMVDAESQAPAQRSRIGQTR